MCECVCVHIQGNTPPYGEECLQSSCLCWFDLGLTACGNTVVHAHITYVLKSCCFLLSNLLSSLSADLPSVAHLSRLLPPTERSVCGAQRQKKARRVQDLSERIQRPPGPAEQQHEHTLPLENRESTRIRMHRHTHRHSHTISSPPPLLLTLPPFTSHFLRPCLLPSAR